MNIIYRKISDSVYTSRNAQILSKFGVKQGGFSKEYLRITKKNNAVWRKICQKMGVLFLCRHYLRIFALTAVLLCVLPCTAVFASSDYPADLPYESYIYNSSKKPVIIPSAFSVESVLTGQDIGDLEFSELSNVYFDGQNSLFLSDSGNNRILITDTNLQKTGEISSFETKNGQDSLNKPGGVYSDGTFVYVADTGNSRIVKFRAEASGYTAVNVFERPEISILSADYEYMPLKLTADGTGRMYVIASGMNQGVLCLDETGIFTSFLGAPQVEPNILQLIWKRFASKEQKARMQSYVPTEYSSILRDAAGFLYVTSQSSNVIPAGKLNSEGKNILKNPTVSFGDVGYDENLHPNFSDIALGGVKSTRTETGIYFVLDSKQGKIYGYSEDGELLYAFGGTGTQKGTFENAVSIEYIPGKEASPGCILVADSLKCSLTVLRETDFGAKIRLAINSYNDGQYDKAAELWDGVKEQASGYAPATVGLARIDMQQGKHRQAMQRLLPIREHKLYSEAFGKWRNVLLRENFSRLIIIAAAAVILILGLRLIRRQSLSLKISQSNVYKGYKYGTYVMFHPFDGFWDLKHEKRGNAVSAGVTVIMFFLVYALRLQFSGYIVTGTPPGDINVLYRLFAMFLSLVLWIVANWCFTTLMDGKGTIKDIFIATACALKPYVLFGMPLLILSWILVIPESAYYVFFDALCVAWVLALLFISLIVTHDYTPIKAVLTVVLILVGICLIIFILLLLIHIVQELWQFVYNVYREISYRYY